MKLGNILKKELKELLTPQTIFSMFMSCFLLIFMGQIMGGAMDEAINNSTVNIVDLDGSDFTREMISKLADYGAEPKTVTLTSEDYYAEMERLELKTLVVIPEGFGENVMKGEGSSSISYYSLVKNGGMADSVSSISASSLTSAILGYVREYTETNCYGLSEQQMELLNEPVVTVEYTAANGRIVQMSPDMLVSTMMSQSMIAPFATFFLLVMAAQTIMTAISTEKIDKTLETLLSAPVSRLTVLVAKMISAITVALLNAASMMVGFVFYMNGLTGGAMEQITSDAEGSGLSLAEGMNALGLNLGAGNMVIFGIEIFLSIAIGLSISLILGAMATDVKSVQTLLLPVMMMSMIPFLVTLLVGMNNLPAAAKVVLYIIPFTHTYTSMSNMMFGNTGLVIGGLIYQVLFFIACMYAAVKMFTTDLLFTMNFSADSGKGMFKSKGAKK